MHANDEPAGAGQPAALDGLSERIRNGGRDHYEFLRCMFGELGDKWAILLLLVLETGELRHAALRRALDQVLSYEKISQRVLTLRLRGMEAAGILTRTATLDVPPKVTYRLTERGVTLARHVGEIIAAFGPP